MFSCLTSVSMVLVEFGFILCGNRGPVRTGATSHAQAALAGMVFRFSWFSLESGPIVAFGHGSGGSAHEEIAAYRDGRCLGRVDLERHGIVGLYLDRLQVVIDIR